ncbi:channel protein, hemolysin III family [Serratia odorifera DSM 4582]|uniref:Channel protein, hemolysin III family n=2 Tax=Serratia odorifera TaxID=618 RepID=D4E225_SEROD|nr:channel protein, hemolysin III family [Serratia odorifera DSM 4582]
MEISSKNTGFEGLVVMGKAGGIKARADKLANAAYPWAEEIANSISHGIGLIFGIVGLVLLLVQAVDTGAGATAIASYSLYGGSMILLYLASTLYHAIPHQKAKYWLKKFDHCAIYLLIAGTYTPFLLVGLDSPLARGLMAVIWGMALFGVIFKLAFAHRFEALSLVTYLTMGWLSLIVIYQLATRLDIGGVTLLAVGGVVYSLGVIFYASKRWRFGHAIWHAFVLGGSVCHFMAIYLYV